MTTTVTVCFVNLVRTKYSSLAASAQLPAKVFRPRTTGQCAQRTVVQPPVGNRLAGRRRSVSMTRCLTVVFITQCLIVIEAKEIKSAFRKNVFERLIRVKIRKVRLVVYPVSNEPVFGGRLV